MLVSIRAPVLGATAEDLGDGDYRLFQSAPPCWGRLEANRKEAEAQAVSIRAPVLGATRRRDAHDAAVQVSIRAPVLGATRALPLPALARLVSIRAPVLGATGGTGNNLPTDDVSIRAPVLGATRQIIREEKGSWRVSIRAPVLGATLAEVGFAVGHTSFNPRPRAGGDNRWLCNTRTLYRVLVSIRAPVLGATIRSGETRRKAAVSIRAPVLGATLPLPGLAGIMRFQSAPPCWGRLER